MNVFIIITVILLSILLFYNYNSYLNKKYYSEGVEIIEKLRQRKSKDETFNSIKKYYINLDRSIERKESVEKEFELYKIGNFERVEACDGKKIDSTKKGSFGDLEFENINDKKISKNAISCTCSHLKAIKKAYDDMEELAIIMEDDIKFTPMPYWENKLSEIIENLPEDLEILQLTKGVYISGLNDFIKVKFQEIPKNQEIKFRNKKETYCCGCYLIRRNGMKKIIDNFFIDDKIVLNLKNVKIDIGILDYMKTYYLEHNLFLLDGFEQNSTISNNDPNYYEDLKMLKFYNK